MPLPRLPAIVSLIFVLSVGPVYAQPAEPEDPAQEVEPPPVPFEEDAPVVKKTREKKEVEEADEEAEEDISVSQLLVQSEKELGKKHHRYLYLGAALLASSGAAFGYSASAQSQLAQTSNSARQATQALESANALATSASLLYGLAAVTLTWAIVMEFLPNENENPPMTFHF